MRIFNRICKIFTDSPTFPDANPELCDIARDRISGFEGVVVGIVKYQFNEDRIGIRPEMLIKGAPAAVEYFDDSAVEVVEKCGMPSRVPPPQRISFGVRVTDMVTGISGIVQAYHKHINGCGRYLVSPDKHEGKVPDYESFTFEQLIVGQQIVAKKQTQNGGPVPGIRAPRTV